MTRTDPIITSAVAAGPDQDSDGPFSRPRLAGRHVYLAPVTAADYDQLYQADTAGEFAARTGFRGATPTFQEWHQRRTSGVLAQFIVRSVSTHTGVGFTSIFSADFQHGYAHLAVSRFDRQSKSPLMILGIGLLLDYAFSCWSFRKVYIETDAYNYAQFTAGGRGFLRVEGRLKDHHYHAGRYWDHVILALYREEWKDGATRFRRIEALG